MKSGGSLYCRSGVKQTEPDANYIDIYASPALEYLVENLKWLIEVVQEATDTPLCIDSPNSRVIEVVFKYANKPGMLNFILEKGANAKSCYTDGKQYFGSGGTDLRQQRDFL